MPKHTPKPAPLTRAGRDLRERQTLAARGSRGGKRPEPVSLGAAPSPAEGRGLASAATASETRADLTTTIISEPTIVAAKINEGGVDAASTPLVPVSPPAEPAPPPAPGTYRIDQLLLGQCRFACTPHGAASHRFCGARTEIGPGNRWGSWCAEHLPRVTAMPGWSPGGASKADLIAKEDVA